MMLMMSMMAAACAAASEPPATLCLPGASDAARPTTTAEVSVAARGGGTLAGTLTERDSREPVVLLLPGSGPTDRNGDSALGVKGAVYRQLADGLAARGIATLRADKRGLGGSKVEGDPNAVTIADYVADASAWRDLLLARGHDCVWLAGHSEGGLIALAMAAEHPENLCGVILIAAPGRRMDEILRAQLKPKLPPALYAQAESAIGKLAKGERVDPASVPAPLTALFAPQVQGYLIDMMRRDPAALAAAIRLPMLIVQGEEDMQVSIDDAKALFAAQPRAELRSFERTNHLLKTVPAGDMAANVASYGDATATIDARVVSAIADFVKR